MREIIHIGAVKLLPDSPTELQFTDLRDWVIWQYPRTKGGWLCGAVHPPAPEYGWLPANINPATKCLRIHAHKADPFATPEEAAEWLASVGK